MIRTKTSLLATLAALAIAAPLASHAADTATTNAAAQRLTAADRDARMKGWNTDKDALEKALGTGHDKAYYRQSLEKAGYHVTSINKDTADELEYEVVKGPNTFEVQVDFDKGVSKDVDVTTNVWKSPNTKAALTDRNWKYAYPTGVVANADRYSDSVRGEAFKSEKDRLEKALGVGHERGYYRTALQKQGYRVTSVNAADAKDLELEVAKGDTSYEVQVEFDSKTGKSTDVDVTTNMWEAPNTDRATDRAADRRRH